MSQAKALPVGEDGFQWIPGTVSNHPSFTLVAPDGQPDAYVYRNKDGTWAAVGWDGDELANSQETSGAAMAIADNRLRPCAHVDTHSSHGVVPCDNDRAPGGDRCPAHRDEELITVTVRDGSVGRIEAGAIRALIGYVEQRDGGLDA